WTRMGPRRRTAPESGGNHARSREHGVPCSASPGVSAIRDRARALTDSADSSRPVDLGRLDAVIGPLLVEAGEIALHRFRSSMVAEDKGGPAGYDPVTAADRMTESFLRRNLSTLFPDVQIIGEEG